MTDNEIYYEIEGSEYGEGVVLECYKEKWGLVAANKSRKSEGTIYKRWMFPQGKDKEPGKTAIPWRITLGYQRNAINMLRYFLEHLGAAPLLNPEPKQTEPSDIPF